MVPWRQAFERVMALSLSWTPKSMKGYRPINYVQTFPNVPAGASLGAEGTIVGPTLQTFPAGAIILGVNGTASIPFALISAPNYAASPALISGPMGACEGNRDLFEVDFAYTNDEQLVPGAPVRADALFGANGDLYPQREIIIDPSQGILTRVRNGITYAGLAAAFTNYVTTNGAALNMKIQVTYACMVPRSVG